MAEHLANLVRLEVDASDISNLVPLGNHSGQTGVTTGWAAVVGALTATATPSLRAASANVSGVNRFEFVSNIVAVLPGQWVGLTAKVAYNPAGGAFNSGPSFARLSFRDGSDIEISYATSTQTQGNGTYSVNAQAPTGTASVRVRFLGSSPYPAAYWSISEVMLVKGAAQAVVKDVPFSTETAVWQDMLGGSYSISIDRGLDQTGVVDVPQVGTLTATMGDPQFDPATNSRMRPGRRIRCRGYDPGLGTWRNLYSGKIATLDVKYRDAKPFISLTATDLFADLQTVPCPRAYNGTFKQRVNAIMAGTGLAYLVADTAANTSSVVIDSDENATALSQLVLVRNSLLGYVYVNQDNVLTANASNTTPPTSTSHLLSDQPADDAVKYTDIDVNFGSQALTNTLMISRRNMDEVEGSGTKTYGPYVNAASVANWGTISATLEVNDGTPSTLANAYLSVYGNPKIFAKGVKFNARDNDRSMTLALNVFPYLAVRVKHASSGIDTVYRVLNIKHDITPDSWEVSLGFRNLETPSTVTVTNPPAGANTGPSDVTPPQPGILGSRYRSGTLSIANGLGVTVPLNAATTMDGITYDSTNNRFVIPRDGRYQINAAARMGGSAGTRVVYIYVNGVGVVEAVQAGGAEDGVMVSRAVKLVAGDVVSLVALNLTGGTVDVYGGPNKHTYMDITFLGA